MHKILFASTSIVLQLLFIHFSTNAAFGLNAKVQNGPLLLYSTRKDLRIANSSRTTNVKVKPNILVRNLTDQAAIDFHYASQKIFWTDQSSESIKSINFNGEEVTHQVEVISNGGLMSPDGLACDWYTNKLYWTDSEANRIEVATITGEHRKVLFWSDIDQPRAIALAPMNGLMFWTDWGDVSKIERAGMNGDPASRQIIVSEAIFWPNGLTIDYAKELIYWVDGRLLFIETIRYDGSNRTQVVTHNLYHPFSITYFDQRLYWTDWKKWSIYMSEINPHLVVSNKTGMESSTLPKELIHSDSVPIVIHVWDAGRQPQGYNPCQKDNGGCSHLCLLAPYRPGYSCACPVGIKLVDNYTCANGPQDILLLALRTSICIIYLDSPDYTVQTIPVNGIKYAIAVDYDPIEDFIYWTDDEVKKIQRARLNGSQQEDVIVLGVLHPDGIAVDWVARNLYWTDTGTDRIEVSRLNGSYRKVLINEDLHEPRAIALAPEHGWMFWTDWYEKSPKIERANLDGSARTLIVNTDLVWPNGVTLDLDRSKVYWSDAKTDKIEYANMDGSDRRELSGDNLPHIFGFSILGDFLYWTDWQRRALDRVHKESGEQREVILDQMANMMGLKAIRLGEPPASRSNPCAADNGRCSHICLNRHGQQHICGCQIGYELTDDGRTCVVPDAFLLYTKRNGIGRISLKYYQNNNTTVPVTAIKFAASIDFDFVNARIYWSDVRLKNIMRAFVNGSDTQKVIELGLSSPKDIAVDWIGHNLYWTESSTSRIEASRLDGSSRRTLLWTDVVDKPCALALDPAAGLMYWSEWGRRLCVKRSAMDGSEPQILLSNTGFVTSLALDYDRHRIYWAELSAGVWSSDMSGFDRRTVIAPSIDVSGLVAPIQDKEGVKINLIGVKLALHMDFVYWSNSETGAIMRANKTSGANQTVVHTINDSPTDLLVFYKYRQKGTNQCAVNNGGCSHLCLTLPRTGLKNENGKTHTCACPTHYILQNNTCLPPRRFMIYSQRNLVTRLLPDTTDCPEAVLSIQGLKAVKAIDFDPVHHYLYWLDTKAKAIKRAEENGMEVTVVVPSNANSEPYDIALDSLGRLLFWTCAIQNVVNVTHLDNGSTVGVVVRTEGEKPRLLAIHPLKRLLFYTDTASPNGHQLVRTRMDGSHKIRISNAFRESSHSPIVAIAVDTENDMIVWTSGSSIYMANIDGENVHVVFNETKARIVQLAVHQGYLYWLDKDLQQLQRLELKTGSSREPVLDHVANILDLVSVYEPLINHSCSVPLNGPPKCSHICIGNETHALCACPQGLMLQGERTCAAKPDCGPDHFTCATYTPAKDCIPVAWKCDGQRDCPDGSDETDCRSCHPDQFRCQSGQCIERTWVCDGAQHCPDGSDEAKCCNSGTEFKCPKTEVCINVALLCDEIDHCANGEDEAKDICTNMPGLTTADSVQGSKTTTHTVFIIVTVIVAVIGTVALVWYYSMKRRMNPVPYNGALSAGDREAQDPLSPIPNSRIQINKLHMGNHCANLRGHKYGGGGAFPDVVHMSMLAGSSYDRNNITGASSSTTNCSMNSSSLGACYPRETLNPPPSPATTAASTRGSSPLTAGGISVSQPRYRPYRHYRSINQPPPPTPCSTDVCDESDYCPSVTAPHRGVPPPPPTPRSHWGGTESCPPSPSSSTYFNPLPPPPSPVPSPPYDD